MLKFTKKILFLFISTSLVMTSCNQEKSKSTEEATEKTEKTTKGKEFKSAEIGWTFTIPEGWKTVADSSAVNETKEGTDAVEKSTGQKVDISGMAQLLNLKKDDFNSFGSSLEPFNSDKEEDFLNNCKLVNKMIIETFKGQNIQTDSATSFETIQGIKFHVLNNSLSIAGKNNFLSQILYSTYIKGKIFSVVISYNNDKDKNDLVNAFKNSKFE